MSAALIVRGLVAGYDRSVVIDGLDLEVADGATAVVIGPNGHGKTTLLRAVSGLIKPFRGEVELGGELGRRDGTCRGDQLQDPLTSAGVRGVGVLDRQRRAHAHLLGGLEGNRGAPSALLDIGNILVANIHPCKQGDPSLARL